MLWGLYHGVLLLATQAGRARATIPGRSSRDARLRVPQIAGMFVLTIVGWLLFRETELSAIVRDLRSRRSAQRRSTGRPGSTCSCWRSLFDPALDPEHLGRAATGGRRSPTQSAPRWRRCRAWCCRASPAASRSPRSSSFAAARRSTSSTFSSRPPEVRERADGDNGVRHEGTKQNGDARRPVRPRDARAATGRGEPDSKHALHCFRALSPAPLVPLPLAGRSGRRPDRSAGRPTSTPSVDSVPPLPRSAGLRPIRRCPTWTRERRTDSLHSHARPVPPLEALRVHRLHSDDRSGHARWTDARSALSTRVCCASGFAGGPYDTR